HGRPPVRAVVTTTRQPAIVLESHDPGRTIALRESDLKGEIDVRDPVALHKIALSLTGLTPAALRAAKVGMRVVTECRVPKGSGLGTSSILAATLLAALHAARGRRARTTELIEQTLLLEQRLSTGGGWQDQVGGIV